MSAGWHVPPPMSRSCDRCGHVGTDVAPTLAESPDGSYGWMDRCRDRAACSARLADAPDPTSPGDGLLDGDASPEDADASESWDFDA